MKDIFPIEIVEYSNEKYWTKRSIKSKVIYIFIICLLLLILFLLPVVHVDISSQSRGSIRSIYENNELQSIVSAEVKRLNIAENQYVSKGDTLVWLESNVMDEQKGRLNEKQEENSMFIQDIDYLLSGNTNKLVTPKYKVEYAQYYSKLREQELALSKARYEYNVSKTLWEKGVETEFEYKQMLNQYNVTRTQLESFKREYINRWQAEKTNLELENKDHYSEVTRIEKQKTQYHIIAPLSGNIVQYTGIKEGNFVVAGQTLAQIASSDSLMAECYVSPSDISYIYNEQNVKLQFDAFDYRQWGLLEGEVTEIISDVVDMDGTPYFRVRCSLNNNYLTLKNGYVGNLKKGMTFTARFILTRRSLAQLLFDKVDNWMNPQIMNHGN